MRCRFRSRFWPWLNLLVATIVVLLIYCQSCFKSFPMLTMYSEFLVAECSPCNLTSRFGILGNSSKIKLLLGLQNYNRSSLVLRMRGVNESKKSWHDFVKPCAIDQPGKYHVLIFIIFSLFFFIFF